MEKDSKTVDCYFACQRTYCQIITQKNELLRLAMIVLFLIRTCMIASKRSCENAQISFSIWWLGIRNTDFMPINYRLRKQEIKMPYFLGSRATTCHVIFKKSPSLKSFSQILRQLSWSSLCFRLYLRQFYMTFVIRLSWVIEKELT